MHLEGGVEFTNPHLLIISFKRTESVHEENSYLSERVHQLELLVDEMVTSNQEVTDEAGSRTEELRRQVS